MNNNNIRTPAQQTKFFDVTVLADMAKVLKTKDQGFFNTTPKSEKVSQYAALLEQYATAANENASERAIETTFKHITGAEYNRTSTQSPKMVAAAA